MSGMKISSPDHIYYGVTEFERDIQRLLSQLHGVGFDLIIGINRGGCLPAVCLSHGLGVPATMIDWSTRDGLNLHPRHHYKYFEELSERFTDILIVDDLVDSGKSLQQLIRTAKIFCNVTVATLLHNTDVNLDVPHIYGTPFSRTTEPRYFDFWWEMFQ